MSLYPTRDKNFTKATESRLRNDTRKNVYGTQSHSLLVTQSYPELGSPNHSTTNTTNYPSPTIKNMWSAINIKNYTIIKKIGSGTYGSVFHGRSPNGCDVAIKQLCPMQNDKHLQDGFHITAIREIKILKSLHHSNIISLHDVICCKENVMQEYHEDHGTKSKHKFIGNRMSTYMVFEYMHHDLSGLLHNDNVSFNIRHIKYFMVQILNALQYCHECALILHRDIKSSNLLVDKDGRVKIADFGLARQYIPELTENNKRIAQTHESINNSTVIHPRHYTNRVVTLWYRAPELLLSDVHYNSSVDLWSVGCVFAELLCNKPIFTGKNEMEQWFQIIEVCGWNQSKEHEWIHNLRDKDGLVIKMKKKCKDYKRKLKAKFVKFLNCKTAPNDKYLDESGFQLLDSLLTMNPNKRVSAKDALESEWFRNEPFPKSPQLDHIQPSHDYEQRQQRKNPNYRSQQSTRRYSYNYSNTQSGRNNGNTAVSNRRERSRSRSRERNGNNNNGKTKSRSGSFEKGKDGSVSLPPPIQRKGPINVGSNQQTQVVTLSAPKLRVNSGSNNHLPKRGYVGYNPDQPHTFYSRFKKPDELKGRSRF